MNESRIDIITYVAQVWRRRWYAMNVATAFCLLGWTVIALLPDKYQASTRIYVDTQSLLSPLMKGIAVEFDLDQQVAIMQRTLLSRPNLESVMRVTDLDLTADTPARREDMLNRLRDNTKVTSDSKNLFDVTFANEDADLAKRVVQSLLTIFVESNLGANRRDMEQAKSFIDEQIKIYESKLKSAEDKLAVFKRKNIEYLPEGGNFSATVANGHQALVQLREELADAQTKLAALKQQMSTVPEYLAVETAPRVIIAGQSRSLSGDIDTRITEMERRLDELRLVYTERHPDVISTRRTLAQLKDERTRAPDRSASHGAISERVPNPLYEQLKLRVVEAQTEVEMLTRRRLNQEKAVVELDEKAKMAPEAEAAFVALNRDYTVIKSNYEKLLERREAARLSQEMDSRADKVIQFRVVEPPVVPLKPSAPNKVLFASLVLIAGLGAGALAAIVLVYHAEAFGSPRHLREAFDLPVLGSVTVSLTGATRQQERASALMFGIALVGLVAAFAGVVLHFGGHMRRAVEFVTGIM